MQEAAGSLGVQGQTGLQGVSMTAKAPYKQENSDYAESKDDWKEKHGVSLR